MHTVAMVGPGHEASAQIARGSGAVRLKAIFCRSVLPISIRHYTAAVWSMTTWDQVTWPVSVMVTTGLLTEMVHIVSISLLIIMIANDKL